MGEGVGGGQWQKTRAGLQARSLLRTAATRPRPRRARQAGRLLSCRLIRLPPAPSCVKQLCYAPRAASRRISWRPSWEPDPATRHRAVRPISTG